MSTLKVGFSTGTDGGGSGHKKKKHKRHGGHDKPSGPTKDQLPDGKMIIYPQNSNTKVVVPYAPREVTYSGLGQTWEEIPRDGNREPILVPRQKNLKKLGFTIFIGHVDWEKTVTKTLDALATIAESRRPVIIRWSSWERGHWRITSMTTTSQTRHPETNEITRATVDIEFTRASDARKNSGPASGGKKSHVGFGKVGDKHDQKGARPVKYKVRAGDTLQSIGMKFYHNHKAWRKIASKNNIKNPRKKLKPGTVLRLP